MKNRTVLKYLASGLVVTLVGCKASTIVGYIDQALQIGLVAAQATGTLPAAYVTYVSAGLDCVSFAASETASADAPAVKAGKITAKCAADVSPNLPAGTPQNLVNLAGALGAQIAKVLAALPPTPAATVNALKASKVPALKSADVAKLKSISEKAAAAKLKFDGAHGG